MDPDKRGWGAFGAFSLGGELPCERPLSQLDERMEALREARDLSPTDQRRGMAELRVSWEDLARNIYSHLEPWETVFVSRHPQRPLIGDYIHHAVYEFCELHGDHVYGDDPAIVTGFGWIGPHRVMLIGHNRGRTVADRVACNFGCAHPEGYRKALAKMRLATKFGLPIVSLIDTPGAYPGMESEQRGVAQAIAANLLAMPQLRVPIVSIVIGEGGSGGALGIAVSDRMAMFEHSIFSVISPEGCAAILWKTSAQAKEAAAALKLRAKDLRELGLIDEIIPEPLGGAHRDHAAAAASLREFLVRTLDELKAFPPSELLHRRHERLRNLGSSYLQMFSPDRSTAGESISSSR
jgi:acetyl-CoA carboxylase carboxyl transferase subunit alpha